MLYPVRIDHVKPEYTTAAGLPGEIATQMSHLAHQIWACDWAGGQEHHLWALYLEALAAPARPRPGSTGALILAFGELVTAAGGLWIWPFDEPEPRWASLEEHLGRHAAWLARQEAAR